MSLRPEGRPSLRALRSLAVGFLNQAHGGVVLRRGLAGPYDRSIRAGVRCLSWAGPGGSSRARRPGSMQSASIRRWDASPFLPRRSRKASRFLPTADLRPGRGGPSLCCQGAPQVYDRAAYAGHWSRATEANWQWIGDERPGKTLTSLPSRLPRRRGLLGLVWAVRRAWRHGE